MPGPRLNLASNDMANLVVGVDRLVQPVAPIAMSASIPVHAQNAKFQEMQPSKRTTCNRDLASLVVELRARCALVVPHARNATVVTICFMANVENAV